MMKNIDNNSNNGIDESDDSGNDNDNNDGNFDDNDNNSDCWLVSVVSSHSHYITLFDQYRSSSSAPPPQRPNLSWLDWRCSSPRDEVPWGAMSGGSSPPCSWGGCCRARWTCPGCSLCNSLDSSGRSFSIGICISISIHLSSSCPWKASSCWWSSSYCQRKRM